MTDSNVLPSMTLLGLDSAYMNDVVGRHSVRVGVEIRTRIMDGDFEDKASGFIRLGLRCN
jgi:hypothetical protein